MSLLESQFLMDIHIGLLIGNKTEICWQCEVQPTTSRAIVGAQKQEERAVKRESYGSQDKYPQIA